MNGTEVALIIGSVAAFVTAIGGVIINAKRLDVLRDENKQLKEDIDRDRKDIISLGEHYAGMSKDVGVLVLLVNKLYTDYSKDVGHKPDIDWSVLDRALTIQHKTSPLGVIETK